MEKRPSARSARTPPARPLAARIPVWILGGVLIVAVAAAAWVGIRGLLAAQHLRSAEAQAREVTAELDDPAAASAAVGPIADETAAARALTSDPVWRAAEALPWLGPQLSAVSTTAGAVDDVVSQALTPLLDVAAGFSLDTLRPVDGRFDLAAVADLAEPAAAAATEVASAQTALAGIDTDVLLPPLAAPITQVDALLSDVYTAADAVSRTAALMPIMLGADGPRDTLVVFQNNAEWRSLGGVVGATSVITAEEGAVALTAQSSSGDFSRYAEGILPLSDELLDIYLDKPALYIQNVTQIPDFEVGAPLAQAMWERESGQRVDGVVAIDPVSLSYILEATGPVTLPTGDVITSENAVELLLNDVYQRYENPSEQDAFFAAAAAAVFDGLASGDADPTTLVAALSRAASERRLLIWNEDETAQAILDGTTLQGGLPVTDAERTSFGVYLNDGTGSKMDYYMSTASAVAWCTDTEGAPDAALSVTLRDDAPENAAELPRYITGGGGNGVTPGVTRTVTYIYLPEGAEVVSSVSTGAVTTNGFGTGTHDGRTVLTWTTDLLPGEQTTANIRVRAPETAELAVDVTPTIHKADSPELASPCATSG